MSLRFKAAVRGDLKAWVAKEQRAGAGAVTTVVRRRVTAAKRNLRAQVRGKVDPNLQNSVRATTDPKKGQSFKIIGKVYSSAIYKKRKGGIVDLITVFDEGAVIRAAPGEYLFAFRRAPRGGRKVGPHKVQTVTIPKLLDVAAVDKRMRDGFDDAVAAEWERRASKAGIE